MEKRINDAFNNIDVVIAQARMTRQEHAQLMTDMKFIRERLEKKIEAEEDKSA